MTPSLTRCVRLVPRRNRRADCCAVEGSERNRKTEGGTARRRSPMPRGTVHQRGSAATRIFGRPPSAALPVQYRNRQ